MRDRRTQKRTDRCYVTFATPAMLLLGYYLIISINQCSVYNAHMQHLSYTHTHTTLSGKKKKHPNTFYTMHTKSYSFVTKESGINSCAHITFCFSIPSANASRIWSCSLCWQGRLSHHKYANELISLIPLSIQNRQMNLHWKQPSSAVGWADLRWDSYLLASLWLT